MKNKQNLFKNLACVSFCLFTFFMASIFVSETYYNRIINEQIQDQALLKSSHFQQWGSMQAPSSVIHKFTPYVYDDSNQATLHNTSINYQYIFQYKNYTFTQGNTGNVRYLNSWKRQPIQQQTTSQEQQKIKVFNIDAETVYNYDYYAPKVRQFALTYNVMYESLIKQFLPLFYASYIFQYLFKDIKMVYSRVLQPLGLTQQQASNIYTHKTYGMNTPELLTNWLQLSLSIQDESYFMSPFYQGLINDMKLTPSQIMYITDHKSTLSSMLIAIKSILKYKLNKLDDDRCSDDFCTDEQLLAAQLGVGFLTKQTIFTSTKIDKYINQLNTTLLNSIQYSAFCTSRPQLQPCSGDDNTAAISFFIKNPFGKYQQVEFILGNLDNPESLQAVYQMNGQGKSLVEYVKFLYQNVFNVGDWTANHNRKSDDLLSFKQKDNNNDKQAQNKYNKKQQTNNNQIINTQAFKRSFTNYNHLQSILTNFQSILFIQIHTRAFYNKFIVQQKKTCSEYYVGDFDVYKIDCQKLLPMLSIDNVRVYVSAYLGVNTEQFINSTTIPSKQLINQFLHNNQKSLLATQLNKLSSQLSTQYNCTSATHCSSQQLMFKQWKNGQILNNLPKQYFSNDDKNVSINKWDYENKLNNVQPQLFKYVNNVSDVVSPQEILNSDSTGIYSLFNMMKVFNTITNNNNNNNNQQLTIPHLYNGLSNSDLQHYIQSLILDIEFSGIHQQLTISEFLNSHQSSIINKKRSINPLTGGAPWLNQYNSVLKLRNQPQKFNYINSGIYDQQKLRSISQIQDNTYSSSTYQVYKSQQQDVKVTYTSQNKVSGTNLFGFQTKIQQTDIINGYFDMIYRPLTIQFKSLQEWKNENNQIINAYKFQIDQNKQFSINVQQLANRTVQLSQDTYFVVEPNTGLTLEYFVKYTVLSKPFYTEYITSSNNTNTKGYPLYQAEISFTNPNTSNIIQISQDQNSLKVLFILGIILSSLSFVSFIVMLVMYRKSRKGNKFGEQNKSLVSSENGGSMTY